MHQNFSNKTFFNSILMPASSVTKYNILTTMHNCLTDAPEREFQKLSNDASLLPGRDPFVLP